MKLNIASFVYNGGTIYFFCCIIFWYFLIFRMIYSNAWNKIFSHMIDVLNPIIISIWLLLKWNYIVTEKNWCSMVKVWFFVYSYKVIGAFLSQEGPLEYMKLVSFTFFAESNQIILAFGWVKFVKLITKSFCHN